MLRVHIARLDDVVPIDAGGAAPSWLGGSERAHWSALGAARRREFVAGRRLLRDALAQATGIGVERWEASAAPDAAPVATRVDDASAAVPQASIAHRLGWVAVATGPAAGGAIGVDIERVRAPRSDPAERAALMLPADDLARWQALPPGEREPALMRAWVARESWFKAQPAGAAWDFRRLACEPCESARANVRLWESGVMWIALCARDASALEAATCEGWPASPASSSWQVRPLDR